MKTRIEFRKFVTGWLWASTNRKTEGREWDLDYVSDAAFMIEEATKGMVSKEELRPILEELKAAWHSVEHIDFSDHMHKAQDKLEALLGDTAKEAP